jgi:hypothetical protein
MFVGLATTAWQRGNVSEYHRIHKQASLERTAKISCVQLKDKLGNLVTSIEDKLDVVKQHYEQVLGSLDGKKMVMLTE